MIGSTSIRICAFLGIIAVFTAVTISYDNKAPAAAGLSSEPYFSSAEESVAAPCVFKSIEGLGLEDEGTLGWCVYLTSGTYLSNSAHEWKTPVEVKDVDAPCSPPYTKIRWFWNYGSGWLPIGFNDLNQICPHGMCDPAHDFHTYQIKAKVWCGSNWKESAPRTLTGGAEVECELLPQGSCDFSTVSGTPCDPRPLFDD